MNRRIGKAVAPSVRLAVADGLLYDEQGRVVAELDGSNNVLSTFVYGLKPPLSRWSACRSIRSTSHFVDRSSREHDDSLSIAG